MTKSLLAIILITLLSTQFALAGCENANIPGYYVDRYTNNQDGTTTDKMTNLMWMKCDLDIPWGDAIKGCQYNEELFGNTVPVKRKTYTWQEALINAQNTNANTFAGKTGWRLPNIKELSSILALHCLSKNNSTALNLEHFDGSAAFYWSSTPDINEIRTLDNDPATNHAWFVSFKNAVGLGAGTKAISESIKVRLVRDNTQ